MKGKVKRGSAGVFRQRAEALRKNLPALATQGARTAELHARRGLMLNVYDTVRGEHYRRTRTLLKSIYAHGEANGSSIGIQLGADAPYASVIEYGSGPMGLTPEQLNGYLEVLPPGGLLRFGRSGRAYLLPGPFIGPALFAARARTHQRVRQLMQDLWRDDR
ncbi:hypothetical protein [Deinococcus radiotolerans]|uniref:Uncharacterized protein n=1 Tax=Deinococcus radiotolerans TaxID=1309407 RepID=A0ABQ2FR35_9DEIO|nr:hypothetical protein [Deinococcus radiotolerans]GGL18308.1 hypothetical protein GCM10010844_41450 [Deinococcus radiotolerans]